MTRTLREPCREVKLKNAVEVAVRVRQQYQPTHVPRLKSEFVAATRKCPRFRPRRNSQHGSRYNLKGGAAWQRTEAQCDGGTSTHRGREASGARNFPCPGSQIPPIVGKIKRVPQNENKRNIGALGSCFMSYDPIKTLCGIAQNTKFLIVRQIDGTRCHFCI